MTMTVNLLPWRAQLREQRRWVFLALLLGVLIAAVGVVLLVEHHLRTDIREWHATNDILRRQVAVADASIEEIGRLQQRQQDITERLTALQHLQTMQPAAVRLFEAVAKAVSPGVQLDLLRRQGERVQIEGVAHSNGDVVEFVRQLDRSELSFQSSLQRITAVDPPAREGETQAANAFVLILDPLPLAPAAMTLIDEGG